MQRPPFSQSPKRVGSGPGGPPISIGAASIGATAIGTGAIGTGATLAGDAAAGTAGGSVPASEGAVKTGMRTSVPELPITDHRASGTTQRMPMIQPGALCLLEDYGVLRFSGADVQKFLQGQLSNDVATLTAGTPTAGTATAGTPTAATLLLCTTAAFDATGPAEVRKKAKKPAPIAPSVAREARVERLCICLFLSIF